MSEIEATLADDIAHSYGCDGTEECDACGGWGTRRDDPDVDCRDCEGRGTVECLGCA